MKQQKKFTKFQLLGNTGNITYFMLLFSFDYLYLTHKCLQNLKNNNEITNVKLTVNIDNYIALNMYLKNINLKILKTLCRFA